MITRYGYTALFLGTFLEGETILIIAGIAAFQGLLDVRLAMLTAFAGTMLGDTVYFVVGRSRGEWLMAKVPRWRPRIDQILALLDRHSIWLILTFRFMYGVRNFTSVAVGMSRTPWWLFVGLNAVGAAVWALCFGMGGFLFGEIVLVVVKDVKSYQMQILGAACVVALGFWLFRQWRKRRRAPRLPKPESGR
jgi:membrane protein DedA with SNARE-associated domain